MSFMRLLSAGRTWVGSGTSQGRYRLDTRYKLPTFGSGKNPFARPENKPAKQVELPMAATVPAPVQPKVKEVLQKPAPVEVTNKVLTDVENRAANLKATQEMPKVVEVQSTPAAPVMEAAPIAKVQPAVEREHVVLRFLDWLELAAIWCKTHAMSFKFKKLHLPSMPKLPAVAKLKPANWMPKRQTQVVAVVVSAQSGPVQAELSLEKVRVVRNDLSDADLEIVPMKPSPPVKPVRRERSQAAKQKTEAPAEMAGVEA